MRILIKRNRRERGIVLILSALMLIFIVIPTVGLAVDAGIMYAIKAKLQTAADGAALAAARSLSRGLDLSSQQTAATDTAQRWFHGNFPTGWMGVASVPDAAITFPAPPPKTIIIDVRGTVQAPTFFMRIFNIDSMTINAMSESTRRDVNIMLVIDRSGSLQQSGSCPALRSAAAQFISSFVNGRDRLGMVTFGTDYRVDFAPDFDFASRSPTNMSTMINQLVCYGYTNAAAAFWTAYQQIVALGDQGALNVILFFTDGMPNSITFGGANPLPAKTQVTPSTMQRSGYDNKNVTTCKDSLGRTSADAGWSPGPFSGVVYPSAGIYKKDTPGYPASPAYDAQKIGTAEGNYGGCAFDVMFNTGGGYGAVSGPGFNPFFDVAYLPDADIFGNLTRQGYRGPPLAAINTWPSSFGAYQGKIRVDDTDNVTNAGINALDNAAQRARADSASRNLGLLTYTIGLGNTPSGVNNELLQRIANDPSAGNYNSNYAQGIYVFAPTAAQLNQAFARIASDVLRFSK